MKTPDDAETALAPETGSLPASLAEIAAAIPKPIIVERLETVAAGTDYMFTVRLHRFFCPACRRSHQIHVTDGAPDKAGAGVYFSGGLDRPTYRGQQTVQFSAGEPPIQKVCRYQIADGLITYGQYCSHDMSGETLALQPVPDWMITETKDDDPPEERSAAPPVAVTPAEAD